MDELKYLTECDENILEAYITDITTTDGDTDGILMVVGMSENQLNDYCIKQVSEKAEKSIATNSYEILLTRDVIEKMYNELKEIDEE